MFHTVAVTATAPSHCWAVSNSSTRRSTYTFHHPDRRVISRCNLDFQLIIRACQKESKQTSISAFTLSSPSIFPYTRIVPTYSPYFILRNSYNTGHPRTPPRSIPGTVHLRKGPTPHLGVPVHPSRAPVCLHTTNYF